MDKDYYEDLNFDRQTECDWCGENKMVSICHYGTTHYNRLVCPECAKKINDHLKLVSFEKPYYFNPDKLPKD